MNLAFGYIRRSSYKQKENNSVEIQKSHIQEFARRKGFEIPDEFIVIEDVTSAYSKRANQRKELMRLRDMMIETNVPRVIFYEESRMDRTGYTFVLDFYRPLSAKLSDLEVYTTYSDDPFNPDNPQTKIALLLAMQESEIKSERASSGLITVLENEDKSLRPGSKVPYGYDQIDKKLVPNDKSEIVTLMFFLQSWGISIQQIATILNEASIPSPQGKFWGTSTVENILKNPVYTGKLIWHIHKNKDKSQTYEFKDSHKPIIDSFFMELNENNVMLQKRSGRLDTPFLFLNKLECRHCRKTLVTQNASTTRNGKKYPYSYYVCKTCKYKLDINDVHDKLVEKILGYVQNLAINETTKASAIEYLNKIAESLKESIIDIEKVIDNLLTKGFIAKENNDREYMALWEDVKTRQLYLLQTLIDRQKVLEELFDAVQSDLFFDRFKLLLEHELKNTEVRLVILYFVDKILVSPEHPPQIIYRESPFNSFQLVSNG